MQSRIVRTSRSLVAIFAIDALGNIGFPAYSLGALVLASSRLHAGAGGYGLLIAAYGLGSLLGNLIVGNLGSSRWSVPLAVGRWSGIGLGFVGLALSHSLGWAIAAVALAGCCGATAHVSRATYIGQTVPDQHLAKVHSLRSISTTAAGAAGTALMGWLMDRLPPELVIGITGAALLVAGLLALATQRALPSAATPSFLKAE